MSRYKKKKLYYLKVYKTRYENQRKNIIFNFINCQFSAYQYLIISNYTICNGVNII